MIIRPYSDGDGPAVRDLVLSIQRGEFAMAITAADQPDLVDVPACYLQRNGHFWVAVADGGIVGTIGLLDIGDGLGALRKMFVARDWRGPAHGIAPILLHCLLDWARAHEFRQIYLGTTERFRAARRFYAREGFVEIGREELPAAFPVMAVDDHFYRLDLATDATPAAQ